MIDYHLHGDFSGHGRGKLEEYVLAALGRGLDEIGFSDHLPKVVDPDPYHAMLEEDLPRYVSEVLRLRECYSGRIRILLGIEADYFRGYEKETKALLDACPFDYVLGGLHFLGDWHFSSKAGIGGFDTFAPDEIFPQYYDLVAEMIETSMFDVLAHPGVIMRKDFLPSIDMSPWYERTAELLGSHGMAIEINTAGLRRGGGLLFPDEALLSECARRDVPVTFGSDAHRPEETGSGFGEAMRLAAAAGVRSFARWEKRRMTVVDAGEAFRPYILDTSGDREYVASDI